MRLSSSAASPVIAGTSLHPIAQDTVSEVTEPGVAPLLRDVATAGRISEFSLTTLAEARPLFVELDPAGDRRLLDHLRPTPLWRGVATHTLGRSDRGIALSEDGGRRDPAFG